MEIKVLKDEENMHRIMDYKSVSNLCVQGASFLWLDVDTSKPRHEHVRDIRLYMYIVNSYVFTALSSRSMKECDKHVH